MALFHDRPQKRFHKGIVMSFHGLGLLIAYKKGTPEGVPFTQHITVYNCI